MGAVDAFPLQRTVGEEVAERMVFFDHWFREKEVSERRCARERARTWESIKYHVELSA